MSYDNNNVFKQISYHCHLTIRGTVCIERKVKWLAKYRRLTRTSGKQLRTPQTKHGSRAEHNAATLADDGRSERKTDRTAASLNTKLRYVHMPKKQGMYHEIQGTHHKTQSMYCKTQGTCQETQGTRSDDAPPEKLPVGVSGDSMVLKNGRIYSRRRKGNFKEWSANIHIHMTVCEWVRKWVRERFIAWSSVKLSGAEAHSKYSVK